MNRSRMQNPLEALRQGAAAILFGILVGACTNGEIAESNGQTRSGGVASGAMSDTDSEHADNLADLWNCDLDHKTAETMQLFELDHQQALLINDLTLLGLDELLRQGSLSSAGLEQLHAQIESCAPSALADQLSDLASSYQGYLQARIELQALYPSQTLDAAKLRAMHEEQIALQADYFGASTAQALFSEQNRASGYMLERMLLDRDTELSDEERVARQAEIEARFAPED